MAATWSASSCADLVGAAPSSLDLLGDLVAMASLAVTAGRSGERSLRPDDLACHVVQCTANVRRTMYETAVHPTNTGAGRRRRGTTAGAGVHRHTASASASATSGRCATSTSTSPRAPCSACSATTAPARPPHPHPHHALRADRGLGRPSPASTSSPTRRGARAHRRRRPAGHGRRADERPRSTSRWSGGSTTCRKARARAPRRRAARAARPRRRRRPAREDVLGRHAPPARPRRQPRGVARGAVPRRADHRARPAQPQRPVGHARASSSRDGTTVILTTQYLEEADRLADDIVVLDHGRTVAHGTPDELKAQHRQRPHRRQGRRRRRARRRGAAPLDRFAASDADRSTTTCSSSPRPIVEGMRLHRRRARARRRRHRRRRRQPPPGHPRRRVPHPDSPGPPDQPSIAPREVSA